MEISEHLGKREGHPVPSWTENPWIYSERGGSKVIFALTVQCFKGELEFIARLFFIVSVLLLLGYLDYSTVLSNKRTSDHLVFTFFLVQVVAVPDLFLTAVKLSHDKTGAQYLHAARDDSNNLFRFTANQCLGSSSLLSKLPP